MGTQKNRLIDASFEHPKQILNDGKEDIHNFMLKILVCLNGTLVTISSVKACKVELMIIGHLSYLR